MLEGASFIVLSSQRISMPYGNCYDFYKSRNGAPLLEYKDFTISNCVSVLNATTLAAMRGGVLELADGTHIATEEQRLVLMEELTQAMIEGGYMIVSDWVAVRPPEFREDTPLRNIILSEQKPNI